MAILLIAVVSMIVLILRSLRRERTAAEDVRRNIKKQAARIRKRELRMVLAMMVAAVSAGTPL